MKKFLVVTLAAVVMLASCKGKSNELEAGDVMPAFRVNDSISSDQFKDKFVLVVFFATWCPGCAEELPYIQHIYSKYKDSKQIEILPVAREQNSDDIQKMWQEQSYTMPAYPDPERKIYSVFASKTIPRTYLFTPTGVLVFKSIGFSTEEMENLLEILNQNILLVQ